MSQFTTGVVEDTTNPNYDQEFTYCLSRTELSGKVLRLVVTDHERSRPGLGTDTNVIGVAVLALDHTGLAGDTETLAVREVWLPVLERNSQHVNDILADRSDISCYQSHSQPRRFDSRTHSCEKLSVQKLNVGMTHHQPLCNP